MRAEPDTADLIALARETLKAELLPGLPPDPLYAALMILNALGIAQRQITGGADRRATAADALVPLTGARTLDSALDAVARTLRHGASAPGEVHRALLVVARLATEESNPGARALGLQPPKGSDA